MTGKMKTAKITILIDVPEDELDYITENVEAALLNADLDVTISEFEVLGESDDSTISL